MMRANDWNALLIPSVPSQQAIKKQNNHIKEVNSERRRNLPFQFSFFFNSSHRNVTITCGTHANHQAPDLGCKRLTCLIFYPVISVKNLTFGKNHCAFHQKRSVILSH